MVREICYASSSKFRLEKYTIGEQTKFKNFHIGDIVLWKHKKYKNGESCIGFLAGTIQKPFVMGLCGVNLSEFEILKKIIKHEFVTKEVFNDLFPEFEIKEVEEVEMSKEEIEEKLGYRIKIVN